MFSFPAPSRYPTECCCWQLSQRALRSSRISWYDLSIALAKEFLMPAYGSFSHATSTNPSLQGKPFLQDSEDIRYMVGALKALGIELEERWEQCEMVVHGCGGRFPAEGGELFLGNAGTAMRCQTSLSQSITTGMS